MKPPVFDYVAATSIDMAIAALAAAGTDAKILAGGQSLVPMLNFRLLRPSILVDINRIPGLDYIRETERDVRVGALTRHYQLETSPLIAKLFPVVACAMTHVAHLAIRNRGTIGGSLSHADPAAELPMLAMLLEAEFGIASANGARVVPARAFFLDALTVDLESAEVLTEIVLPKLPAATGWGFEEVARRHGDFALAAVAVLLTVAGGAVKEARIALTGVGADPAARRGSRSLAHRTQSRSRIDRPRHRRRAGDHHAGNRSARLGGLPAASRRRSRRPGDRPGMAARLRDFAMSGSREITVTVNGTVHAASVEPRLLLADFLRSTLGLTGTHVGCEHGVCGACTVLVDGDSARACLMLAVQADGRVVESVESLGRIGQMNALQEAFHEHHALQCGFCTPGMLMTATDLLRKYPLASDDDIRKGLSGNLCRCTGYEHIVKAIRAVLDKRAVR